VPSSHEFIDIQGLEFETGRFYNESEESSVIVLGNEIAKSLFDGAEPIGKNVRLYGKRFTVIGVLKKKEFIWDSNDTTAYIPVNFVRQLYGDNNDFDKCNNN
jgi:putative ABC transport system permease protein